MRHTALAFVSMLVVATPVWSQLERVEPDVEVPSVSVDELSRAVEAAKPPRLIDVRLEEDFAADPVLLPDAQWRDPHDIDTWAKELSADTPVIVYCVAGRWVSQSVAKKLMDLGFDVAQLGGGIEAWAAAGKPTESSKKP